MRFHLIDSSQLPASSPPGTAYLSVDKWDDWGKYRTQFYLYVCDNSGKMNSIGEVKIGQRGLKPGPQVFPGIRAPQLPSFFETLPSDFFSLGQTDSYYESLNDLSVDLKTAVLRTLRDVALDLELFKEIESEEVTSESLLRYIKRENVLGRLHRLSIGDATLTAFDFSFHVPEMIVSESADGGVSFSVSPDSMPPTNVHAVIGRNGVGKTRFIQHIVSSIMNAEGSPAGGVELSNQHGWSFSGIVSVSFSAFDDLSIQEVAGSRIPVSFVGLRSLDGVGIAATKTPHGLVSDFVECIKRCSQGIKRDRWRDATFGLYSDPVFADSNPLQLLDLHPLNLPTEAATFFGRLSSGHKIVLLTITKLVDLISEKTLVLLDEPEGHLHPPLLSALVRSLSRLLTSRNGIAIVATHSPVVLQEVPRDCTWIIHRAGRQSKAERPSIETFGENVSVLTREVFGLEVTNTGFMDLITKASKEVRTYEELVNAFGGKLGTESRAIARSIMNAREKGGTT